MTLGQRIQELRKQQGLSQEALGEALGVSRQAVSKWELDNGIPELDTLIAMSRLFGITVGQLLGVEEASENDSANNKDDITRDTDDDRIESVLHRYTEQKAKDDDRARLDRLKRLAAVGVVAAVLFAVMFVRLGSLSNTVRLLRSDLSNLQVSVNNSQSNLTGQIRNTIHSILAEEARLLNTFDWEINELDLENKTATLQFDATMKEYTAGSLMQFCAKYETTDLTEGQVVSEWVAGPDFSSLITLPLNHLTEITIRVKDSVGNILEQPVDEDIYSLHPDSMCLNAYNLTVPFAVTIKGFGATTTSIRAEDAAVTITSAFPEIFRPVHTEMRAYVNDTEILCEAMTITQSGRDKGMFAAELPSGYHAITLKNHDKLSVRLTVTDNLGRSEEFFEYAIASDGDLMRPPMVAPITPLN